MNDNENQAVAQSGDNTTRRLPRSYILKDYTEIQSSGSFTDHEGIEKPVSQVEGDIIKFFDEFRKNNHSCILLNNSSTDEADQQGVCLHRSWGTKDYTGQYAGLILDKNTHDVYFLHSRFDPGKNFHFTNYILSKALQLNSRVFLDMDITRSCDRAMQLLLAIVFMNQIRVAFKSGIYRCYRNYEQNDSRVRGRIQVERHIKLNPLFNGNIAYTYREYTADNDVNRIILTAYEALCKKSGAFMRSLLNSPGNRSAKDFFAQIKNITTPASRQEIQHLLRNSKKKIHHSVYRNWEHVRKTAIQILKHAGIRTQEDGSTNVSGVLIDMPKIWEKYLERVLQEQGISGFTSQTEVPILEGKRTLKPDFWNNEERIVLDAKYTNAWSNAFGADTWDDRTGTFQVLTYMYVLGCNTGGILCPAKGPHNPNTQIIHKELLGDKKMAVIPLIIPSCESYEDFVVEIAKSEKIIADCIKELAITEQHPSDDNRN